jgi:hypothetical protein
VTDSARHALTPSLLPRGRTGRPSCAGCWSAGHGT